jgi:methyl-accepting chemotaxis protein
LGEVVEMKRTRLSTKIFILMMALSGATIVITAVFTAWIMNRRLTDQYESKGTAIAHSVANSSVDALLYRDASTVQSLVDQYLETEGVAYVFVVDAKDDIVCHTFVPGIPENIRDFHADKHRTMSRPVYLQGLGPCVDVSSPILEGEVGYVHVGIDRKPIRDSVATAVMQQAALMTNLFLLGGIIAYVLMRRLVRPLQQMQGMLRDIAEGEGDLTAQITITSRDEVGESAHWFNTFLGKLRGMMGHLKQTGVGVAAAAHQVSAASDQLLRGSQEQASSLEETAASLEEITSSVKQNADNAEQANQLAAESRRTAEKGGEVVGSAVTAMAEISQSSRRITDIISTIDEIAFQTNLLALNAAVEAARAGEQGRGFAVVAAEVRSLAQRSAAAAKEIKGLIQDSVRKVDAGTELVNRSGQTLGDIVTSVRRVSDLMAEIAAASREQAAGISQVTIAMTRVDGVARQTAAQTEELSSTSETLSAQAGELHDLIGQFKLEETAAPLPGVLPPLQSAASRNNGSAENQVRDRPGPKHNLARKRLSASKDGFEEF